MLGSSSQSWEVHRNDTDDPAPTSAPEGGRLSRTDWHADWKLTLINSKPAKSEYPRVLTTHTRWEGLQRCKIRSRRCGERRHFQRLPDKMRDIFRSGEPEALPRGPKGGADRERNRAPPASRTSPGPRPAPLRSAPSTGTRQELGSAPRAVRVPRRAGSQSPPLPSLPAPLAQQDAAARRAEGGLPLAWRGDSGSQPAGSRTWAISILGDRRALGVLVLGAAPLVFGVVHLHLIVMVRLLLIPSGMDWHFPAAPSLPTPGAQPGHRRFNEGRAERPDPPSSRARSEPPQLLPAPAGASQPNPQAQLWELCHWWKPPSRAGAGANPAPVRLVAGNYGAAPGCVSGIVVLTVQTCRGRRLRRFSYPDRFSPLDFKSHKARKLPGSVAVYKLNRNRLWDFGLCLFFSRQVLVWASRPSRMLLSDVRRSFAWGFFLLFKATGTGEMSIYQSPFITTIKHCWISFCRQLALSMLHKNL